MRTFVLMLLASTAVFAADVHCETEVRLQPTSQSVQVSPQEDDDCPNQTALGETTEARMRRTDP